MFLKVLLINTYYHHTEPINTQSIMDPKISDITVIYQYRLNQKPDNQHKPTSVSISHCPTNLDLFFIFNILLRYLSSQRNTKFQYSLAHQIPTPLVITTLLIDMIVSNDQSYTEWMKTYWYRCFIDLYVQPLIFSTSIHYLKLFNILKWFHFKSQQLFIYMYIHPHLLDTFANHSTHSWLWPDKV